MAPWAAHRPAQQNELTKYLSHRYTHLGHHQHKEILLLKSKGFYSLVIGKDFAWLDVSVHSP